MKKKLIALVLMLTLALTFGLVACGGDEEPAAKTEATAWGFVHGGYVASATVKKDSSKASGYSVEFHEYYLMDRWANASIDGGEVTRAAKVMVGDQTWTLDGDQNGRYKNEAGVFSFNYFKDAGNAKWYGEQILAGNFWILDAQGNKVDDSKVSTFNVIPYYQTTALDKIKSLDKPYNGYWQKDHGTPSVWETKLGHAVTTRMDSLWNYNIQTKLGGYLESKGFAFVAKDITTTDADHANGTNSGGAMFVIGGVVTGSTAMDARDYLDVAHAAYRLLIGA